MKTAEVSFNKSFNKGSNEQESSFNKSFSRRRVFENSQQIAKDGAGKTPSLKNLIREKEIQYLQQFEQIFKEVEESDKKEVIFNNIDAPQIFSKGLDKDLEVTPSSA